MKPFRLTPELSIAALGILCVTILETLALLKGVDGVMFGSAMAGVGGCVGWAFKSFHATSGRR